MIEDEDKDQRPLTHPTPPLTILLLLRLRPLLLTCGNQLRSQHLRITMPSPSAVFYLSREGGTKEGFILDLSAAHTLCTAHEGLEKSLEAAACASQLSDETTCTPDASSSKRPGALRSLGSSLSFLFSLHESGWSMLHVSRE